MRPGGEVIDVRAAYAHCEEVTWSQARNFSYGIRLLPPAKRQALAAVYAFARRIDDIGDGTLPAGAKLAALADARASVDALIAGHRPPAPPAAPAAGPGPAAGQPPATRQPPATGQPPATPPPAPATVNSGGDLVLVALADAAGRFDIPLAAFGELIDGCEADVRGTSYRTFDDLLHYCRCVAGSIGRLSLGVFGTPDVTSASPLADSLGVALQLTNILRDIREDYLGGRVYLPSEDFERFGCTLALTEDRAGDQDKLVALVEFEARRAREWYARGLGLIPLLDRRSAASAGAMAGIYFRLLDRITASPRAVLSRRVSLSTGEKALVALKSLATALGPRAARAPHGPRPPAAGEAR